MKRCFLIVLLMLFTVIAITAQDTVTHDDYEIAWDRNGSEESMAAWDRVIAARPDWAEGYIGRASGYWSAIARADDGTEASNAAHQAALADIEMAIELTGGDYYLWLEKGRLLRSFERMDEAEASFLQAIEINPRDSAAYRWLVGIYSDAERYEDALNQYQHLLYLPVEYRFWLHYLNRSDLYADLNDEANQTFNQLIADGLELTSDLDYEDALEDFEAALELAQQSDNIDERDEALIQYHIADAHRWIQYLDSEPMYSEVAENALQEAIRLAPDWDLPYVILSRLYQALDDSETAIEILDEALIQLPDSSELYKERARYHTDRDAADITTDFWTYLKLTHQHTFDTQPLDMVNNTTQIAFINGWHLTIPIEAESGDLLFTTFDEEEVNGDFIFIVLDNQQQPVASHYFVNPLLNSEPQTPMFDWRIPAIGTYTLIIVFDQSTSLGVNKAAVQVEVG